jgi:chromosome segregation ATPase
LQSYHKRLQILQKRIKTYALLVKSEQSSYVEKYKQLKKGIRNSQELENENDDLKDQIKRIRSLLEEKELNITSLNHQVKLEKGRNLVLIIHLDSYEKLLHSNQANTERTVNDSLQRVKDIDSINNALKTDNDRLLHRIQELERDNIKLKTDIATIDTIKKSDSDNLIQRYENMIKSKDQNIQSMQLKIDELEHTNKRLTSNIQKFQGQIYEFEQECNDKIAQIKQEKNRALIDREGRIRALEEENKETNQKISRINKFRQSVFSLEEDSGYNEINYQPMQASHSQTENIHVNITPESKNMMTSQEFLNMPKFVPDAEFKTLGSSRDKPIELQPVRISSASSHYGSHQAEHLRKASGSDYDSLKSYEEAKNQPIISPVNNPYFKGSMHGANMMLGIGKPTQALPVQKFNHELQTSKNDRNWLPPTSMNGNVNLFQSQ